jgi:hypothetical protein
MILRFDADFMSDEMNGDESVVPAASTTFLTQHRFLSDNLFKIFGSCAPRQN